RDPLVTGVQTCALPIFTTFMGRGLLEGSDALLGTYFGPAGAADVSAVVDGADLALLLGVIPSDTNFALSQQTLAPQGSVLALDRSEERRVGRGGCVWWG